MTSRNKNIPALRFKNFRDNWNKKELGDICTFYSGGTPASTNKNFYSGNIPFIGSGNIYDSSVSSFITEEALNSSSAKMVEKGDLLYALYGANSGEVAISKISGAINQAILCIRSNHENIQFLYALLLFNKDKIVSKYLQGGQGNLSANIIKGLKYHFPSLPEQKKIASFLSAIDEKIRQLTKKKELLEQYKKGVMQQLFSGKLRFRDERGRVYPKWEEKTLLEVANFRRGSFPQPYGLAKWYDDEHGAPFIQVFDVDENMLLKPDTKRHISAAAQKLSVFVKKGTLVLTIQGSIGRIAKTQYDAYVDRTLLIFQDYKVPINIDFLKYVIFLLFEIEKTKAPGGTIKTITKEKLSDFKIMIPKLEEQQKIAAFLSSLDTKIESVRAQIEGTQRFKKGLLQQMFV